MFLFFAAQLAIPYFEEAQQSFIDYMDISTELDQQGELIKSGRRFQVDDTNGKYVYYRDHGTVNDYCKTWNIEVAASDNSVYGKCITYSVQLPDVST